MPSRLSFVCSCRRAEEFFFSLLYVLLLDAIRVHCSMCELKSFSLAASQRLFNACRCR